MKRKQLKNIDAEAETSYSLKRYNLHEFLKDTERYISTERHICFSSRSARALDTIDISLRRYAGILAIAFRNSGPSPSLSYSRIKNTARFLISGVDISDSDSKRILELSEKSGFSVEFCDGGVALITEIKIGISNVIGAKSKRIVYNTLVFEFSNSSI